MIDNSRMQNDDRVTQIAAMGHLNKGFISREQIVRYVFQNDYFKGASSIFTIYGTGEKMINF